MAENLRFGPDHEKAGSFRPDRGTKLWAENRLAWLKGCRWGMQAFIRLAKSDEGKLLVTELNQRPGTWMLVYVPSNSLNQRVALLVTEPVWAENVLTARTKNTLLNFHCLQWSSPSGLPLVSESEEEQRIELERNLRWYRVGEFRFVSLGAPDV